MTKIISNKSNVDLDYPVVRPSLDLDFTQEELDPRITFSRGTVGTRVNRNRLIETVSTNQPRFDYDPVTGECKGLLIEESGGNVRSYSDAITTSNLYGANTATLTQVTTTTPISGLSTATKVFLNIGANAGNSQNGFNFGSGISLSNSTVYTQSIFVKASGSSVFRLRSNVTGQVFDIPIAGPAPAPTGTITSCTVTPYPDGWSRISWTFTSTTSTPGNRGDHWAIKPNIADGSSGFLVTGAQLEASGTLTSYIPTTASTVTRSTDLARMTGTNFSSWYNPTEGTLYAAVRTNALGGSGFPGIAYVDDGTVNNSIGLVVMDAVNDFLRTEVFVSNSLQHQLDSNSAIIPNQLNKVITSYSANNFSSAFSIAGPVKRDIRGSIPIVNRLLLGDLRGGNGRLNGVLARFTYYPRKLKDNQLLYLTQ